MCRGKELERTTAKKKKKKKVVQRVGHEPATMWSLDLSTPAAAKISRW
jgi:hypothetical protein